MINFYISAFLADLALGAVLLSLPLLLIYKFNADSLLLGLLGALGSFVFSSGVIGAGLLSDKVNRKKILLFGCGIFIVSYAVLPFLNRVNQIFFIYIFGAASMSLFWPIIQSWLSQGLDKDKLVKSLTNFNVYWSAGVAAGFFLAGFLFSLNEKIPFIFGVCVMAVVILILLKQPVFSEVKNGHARNVFLATEKDRPERAQNFLVISWCANFMSWYVVGTVRNLFPKLAREIGFSSGDTGVFVFLMFLSQTVMFFILGRTHKWHYRILPIVLFQMLAIIALFLLTFSSQSTYFIIAMICLGLSNGMTYFSSIFYSLYGVIDKGRKSGIHEAFIGAGSLFGPLIGGIAAHAVSIRAPYLIATVLIFIAVVMELIMYHRDR